MVIGNNTYYIYHPQYVYLHLKNNRCLFIHVYVDLNLINLITRRKPIHGHLQAIILDKIFFIIWPSEINTLMQIYITRV